MRALLFLTLLAACQQSGSAPERGSGSGSAAPKKPTTLDIQLPAVSGRSPRKTSAPLAKADLDRLTALRFPEFTIEMTPSPDGIAIRQRAAMRPRMSVNIMIGPCGATRVCRPMKLAAWTADEVGLKQQSLDVDLIDRPDTVFEIVEQSLGGATVIETYQAGQYSGPDANGNPVHSYSHAVTLHHNDGVNVLQVTATFADTPRPTLRDMQDAMPRSFLERVATAFLDAYGQAWSGQ